MKLYIKYSVDGDSVMATLSNFKNLVISPAGFGNTVYNALDNLIKEVDISAHDIHFQKFEEAHLTSKGTI